MILSVIILTVVFCTVVGCVLAFDKKVALATANIIGMLPFAWDGLLTFLSNFVGATQTYQLSSYIPKDDLVLYFVALCAIDGLVHAFLPAKSS